MSIIDIFFQYIIPSITLIFVAYDKIKSKTLRAKLNGKKFIVPNDEVKEAFRRSALAESSRLAGGRRVNLSMEWKGNLLEITSQDI